MRAPAVGRTWDSASSPEASRRARQFESAWRASDDDVRPDPLDFLPDDEETRPGVRLALLRTDMTLRREAGEPATVDSYLDRIPDLDEDTVVGLIYEEFCLREEEFDRPETAEYIERFPHLAARLRRVLEIHDLVGAGHSTAFHRSFAPPDTAMPGVGETIAGFRLVQELGRGTFARVFLAEEQALGDRSVALKVSRAASREPQALARLQHTHIVPIHSYQTDPESGLHLLCMPYFGRVTLAGVLADPKVRSARSGAEVVSAIDRLDPAGSLISDRPAGRLAMSRRSHARALAWWGARLAEALQHAHDRGVLHRDIKPSNVLITGDGLPMLLDFNLAWESLVDSGESGGVLGGTVAYMAPEHLEALTLGDGERIDGRADVYSLGVVLFEALDARPFPAVTGASSLEDALARAMDQRRVAPRMVGDRVEIPRELEIVVRKCLAPDPLDRYARPGDLAEDLQAVADDMPLCHAQEPFVGRSIRWVRRNRRPLAVSALGSLVAAGAIGLYFNARKAVDRDRREVRELIDQGVQASETGKMELAVALFRSAVQHAGNVAELAPEASEARRRFRLADQTNDRLTAADALHDRVDGLRLRLLGFVRGDDIDVSVRDALGLFYVLDDRASMPDRREWFELDGIALLDTDRRNRVFDDVDELLFLRALAIDARKPIARESVLEGVKLCDLGLKAGVSPAVRGSDAGANPASWKALRARFEARLRGDSSAAIGDPPTDGASASECHRWGLILKQAGDTPRALDWLRTAARRAPADYWYAFYLAYALDRAGLADEALTDYSIAIALRESMPWAYLNRSHIYRSRGAWDLALADLRSARDLGFSAQATLRDVDARDFEEAHVLQNLFEISAARRLYRRLADRPGDFRGAALLNLASLDAEEGRTDLAMAGYDRILDESPADSTARLARAQLALRLGGYSAAERDLNALLRSPTESGALVEPRDRADAFACRARVRLASGWPIGALEDAERASALAPGPGVDRLVLRASLAAGRVESLRPDGPGSFDLLPMSGSALKSDLIAAAERLSVAPSVAIGADAIGPLLARASILAFLGNLDALTDVNRALAVAPGSTAARLLRARVRARLNAREGAAEDVEDVLRLDPDDPRALVIRGRIRLDAGDAASALVDLDRAIARADNGATRSVRAAALSTIGRHCDSVDDWTHALRADPQDPRLFLGRGRSQMALGRWDHALADLESAATWASGSSELLAKIADAYAECVRHRPGRKARAEELRRTASGAGMR